MKGNCRISISLRRMVLIIPQILYFSWFFTYKAKDACYMGEKRFFKVSVVYLSLI